MCVTRGAPDFEESAAGGEQIRGGVGDAVAVDGGRVPVGYLPRVEGGGRGEVMLAVERAGDVGGVDGAAVVPRGDGDVEAQVAAVVAHGNSVAGIGEYFSRDAESDGVARVGAGEGNLGVVTIAGYRVEIYGGGYCGGVRKCYFRVVLLHITAEIIDEQGYGRVACGFYARDGEPGGDGVADVDACHAAYHAGGDAFGKVFLREDGVVDVFTRPGDDGAGNPCAHEERAG
ncbi:hypothetical protein AALK14_14770 [Butyricimonas hominis]|uniref:hypothetical protein n=1 Tax=Butyricimonas TaxID=574697 RepID=UPI003515153B